MAKKDFVIFKKSLICTHNYDTIHSRPEGPTTTLYRRYRFSTTKDFVIFKKSLMIYNNEADELLGPFILGLEGDKFPPSIPVLPGLSPFLLVEFPHDDAR